MYDAVELEAAEFRKNLINSSKIDLVTVLLTKKSLARTLASKSWISHVLRSLQLRLGCHAPVACQSRNYLCLGKTASHDESNQTMFPDIIIFIGISEARKTHHTMLRVRVNTTMTTISID
jgi:hypothetical protein